MRSVELFSGAGGLALGLERAGFEPVALVEKNRDAGSTLRLNRPHWNELEGDIQGIDFRLFSDIDLVAGGPPCQPFSMGGSAKGHTDRRDMFPEAVRVVRELQPKAFIFENVRGLLRASFRNYVEFIRLQLMYPNFPVSRNVNWEAMFSRKDLGAVELPEFVIGERRDLLGVVGDVYERVFESPRSGSDVRRLIQQASVQLDGGKLVDPKATPDWKQGQVLKVDKK